MVLYWPGRLTEIEEGLQSIDVVHIQSVIVTYFSMVVAGYSTLSMTDSIILYCIKNGGQSLRTLCKPNGSQAWVRRGFSTACKVLSRERRCKVLAGTSNVSSNCREMWLLSGLEG